MYRSVISLLILTSLVGTLIAINPQARQEATLLWEEARPTLVGWRDKALEVFRTLLSGDPDAQIEHEPVLPEQNIEFIITLNTHDRVITIRGSQCSSITSRDFLRYDT